MVEKLVGASPWEQELYAHLTTHEDTERELLVEYQQAANDSDSAAFRFLASLIVEDEIRHHRIFRDLASSLRTDAEFRPEEPAIPRLDHWGRDPRRVQELAERLYEHEQEDAKMLRRLHDSVDDLKDTTLWVLLIKLMEMDTAKHREILDFVRRHAKKAIA